MNKPAEPAAPLPEVYQAFLAGPLGDEAFYSPVISSSTSAAVRLPRLARRSRVARSPASAADSTS